MKEQSGMKPELIEEISVLKQRIQELEQSESECKQSEEALQKSYALLKSVFESPKEVVIFALDRQYRYIAFNENHHQTMKRIWGVDIAVGNSMLEYIKNPEDCMKAKNNFDRALSGESFTLVEAYGDTALDRRYYEDIYNPIIDESGDVIGLTLFLIDITERKQAEKALKESEQKLTNIIDFLPDATFVIDIDKKVVAWNRAMEEMTGVKKEDMIGQGNYIGSVPFYGERRPYLLELIDADDKELESKYEHVQKKGDTLYAEAFTPALYGGKGAYLWATGAPLFDDTGNRIGAIESIRDITNRKLLEGELVWKTAFLEAQVEATIDGILVVDDKGQKILANQHLLDIWKVPQHIRDDKDDAPLLQYVMSITKHPEQFLEKVMYLYDHPNETSRDEIEFKDGMVLDRYSSPVLGKDGKYYGRIWTFQDITERKRAERELRRSNELLQAVIEAAPTAIIGLDLDGIVHTVWNRAAEKMLGWSAQEVMGHRLPSVQTESQEEFSSFREKIRRGMTLDGVEVRRQRKDGTPIDYSIYASPLRDPDDRIVGNIAVLVEITDRKRAEDALRQNEEQLRLVTDNMVDLVLQMDAQAVFQYVTPSVTRLLGYRIEDVLGKYAFDFVYPDDRDSAMNAFREAMKTGHGMVEARLRHNEGHYIWMELIGNVLFTEKGAVKGIIIGGRDITGRKRIQEELISAKQRLKDIIDFLPDATLVIDNEGKVIAWNRAIEEMTGIKAEDILGKGNYEYALPFYGERRPILIDLILKPRKDIEAKYVSTERGDTVIAGEAYVPALRGREAYLFGTASILHDSRGTIVGAIESIRDITERKRTEEALRESEERFRALSENAPDIIYTLNLLGAFTYVNPSWKRIMGHDAEELVGRYFNDFAREEDRKAYRKLFKGIRDEGKSVSNYIGVMLTKDGKERIFNMNSAFNRDSEGRITGVVGSMQDVTELREIEKKLNQAQKMEAVGTLAGGIAHDFNNILGAILGYTEIALTDPKVDERLRRYLNQVYTAGERATDLVKQILAFSRQSDQKPRPLRVSPIVKEVMKLLRASLPTTIKIRQDIQSEPDTVLADPTQLHQILMNLCTNAGHAMRETKGELKVSLVPVEIKPGDALIVLHDLTPGMYLKLTVSDTGAGIAPEIMDRIFDPFFTTKGSGEGTGMGLSVVHGIVKSYHGAITVESEVGKGTAFHIYLPLLKEAGEKRQVKAAADITGGKERILFVDDEEMLVQIGKDMLTSLGYEVIERTSSLEARKLFQSGPDRFDLVITDMTMPNMTGIELAKEIMRIRPGIPVILCTGFSEEITPEKATAIGLKDFIMKPLIRNKIAAAIRRALDQKGQG